MPLVRSQTPSTTHIADQLPADDAFVPKSTSWRCVRNCGRSVPICNMMSCTLGVVGAVIGIGYKATLDDTLRNMLARRSSSHVSLGLICLHWSYVASLIVFGLAFIVGVIGTGMSRELLFSGGDSKERCLANYLQVFAGPIFTRIVQALLLLLYIAQLLISHCLAVVTFLVFLMDATCQSGPSAINTLTQLSELMKDANQQENVRVFDGVEEFCSEAADMCIAAIRMFVASLLILVSLTPLLASVTSTKERIRAQMQNCRRLKAEAIESDAVASLHEAQVDKEQPEAESVEASEATPPPQEQSFETRTLFRTCRLLSGTPPSNSEEDPQSQKGEDLKRQVDCRNAELTQERQQRTMTESELAEVRGRADQLLGKWRKSALANNLPKLQLDQDPITTAEPALYSPKLQQAAYQHNPADQACSLGVRKDGLLLQESEQGGSVESVQRQALVPKTANRRLRSKQGKDVPCGLEPDVAPLDPQPTSQAVGPIYFTTPVQNTPAPKRSSRRNSRSSRKSDSSQEISANSAVPGQ